MKRIGFTAAVVLAAALSLCAFAKTDIPEPTSEFFVNDYANVLDGETENYIFETGKAYNNNGGPQVVVLTMPAIDGDVESFSIDVAREWGIGDKDEDNGVLITLVTDSRDIRVEVGYGLEGVLNDAKCGRFIRNASPMLSEGDYSGGIKQLYDDIIGELEEPSTEEEDEDDIGLALAIAAIVFLIIIGFWGGIYRRRGGRGGFGGGYGGGFGGGFGGGSSGGGFSGGGGSFGGGGASGKF